MFDRRNPDELVGMESGRQLNTDMFVDATIQYFEERNRQAYSDVFLVLKYLESEGIEIFEEDKCIMVAHIAFCAIFNLLNHFSSSYELGNTKLVKAWVENRAKIHISLNTIKSKLMYSKNDYDLAISRLQELDELILNFD